MQVYNKETRRTNPQHNEHRVHTHKYTHIMSEREVIIYDGVCV
jgi:hypothetical protein